MLKSVINKLHKSKLLGTIFHTLDYCLQKELGDCRSALDLGCGPNSPITKCVNIEHSVGVELFKPYLKEARENRTHDEFIEGDILELDFEENSFDAVILIDVLEHLNKSSGKAVLERAKKWAKKKVVVTTPNGFIEQAPVDENPHQAHKSGWNYNDMLSLGFEVYGLAGLKYLRRAKEEDDSMDDNLLVSIKYKPKFFWFGIATFSQIFTYFFPEHAFELFCVKHDNFSGNTSP
ncbi:methyltransferase domain-containing protein [candidate division WWE3 bacterium]|nr:methyltransferase domain-containing protein [candidate division WWE3 bacterium]